YTEDKLSVPLIVASPYDRLYPAYLKMKIDGENGETPRYNNSVAEFNAYLMEFRRYYNKTHLPLSNSKKPTPKSNPSSNVSDAMYEKVKRELYSLLSEDFANMISKDKLYDIVTEFARNNVEMLKGKDGMDGKDGKDGIDGKDGESISQGTIERIVANLLMKVNKISSLTLFADKWHGTASPYTQVVTIAGTTKNSKIDLNPTVEQLNIFHTKDLAFVVGNNNGTITVYCIGEKPTNDYTMQITITEVANNV
ncbi:MAG: hypothetical protein U0L88_16645, partial [Acutalibacteraceae bacterium]|nr:hypothetical protein [Acutalibacteraceae bacterium]